MGIGVTGVADAKVIDLIVAVGAGGLIDGRDVGCPLAGNWNVKNEDGRVVVGDGDGDTNVTPGCSVMGKGVSVGKAVGRA